MNERDLKRSADLAASHQKLKKAAERKRRPRSKAKKKRSGKRV